LEDNNGLPTIISDWKSMEKAADTYWKFRD